MRKNVIFFFFFLSVFTPADYSLSRPPAQVSYSEPLSCKEIVSRMLVSIDGIRTLKFHLKFSERVKGKYNQSESIAKINKTPRKIYMNFKGPELLWVQGKNNGKALVNPNGFPYINLNLDPMGSFLRDNQHHTIHEAGFNYYADIIRYFIKFIGADFDSYFKYKGDVIWNNRECYHITVDYPQFKAVNYIVKKGEDLVKIARALYVSEFMMLEMNAPEVSGYYDVKEGQIIKVPNNYAKKTEMLIDKENMLPISTKVYDDKGLFEAYEYDILLLNPKINDEEFTKGYKDYNF